MSENKNNRTDTLFFASPGWTPRKEIVEAIERYDILILRDDEDYLPEKGSNGGCYARWEKWQASGDGWYCMFGVSHDWGVCPWCGQLDQDADHEDNWGCGPTFLTDEELADHLSYSVDYSTKCHHFPEDDAYTLCDSNRPDLRRDYDSRISPHKWANSGCTVIDLTYEGITTMDQSYI